jgi:hypothetical protein
MYQAFQATIDNSGAIRLDEQVQLPLGKKALIIVLDDGNESEFDDTALVSEESLAESWNSPEEDAAWAYLQSEQ